MSSKRPLQIRLPRAAGMIAVWSLLLGFGATCSTYSTYKNLPIPCTIDDAYELYDKTTDTNQNRDLTLDNYQQWFGSPDYTPNLGAVAGADAAVTSTGDAGPTLVASAQVLTIDLPADAGVCGSTTVGIFRGSHNDDWGGIFGSWGFGSTSQDASDWEGIAFWARAPGPTTKGFTLSLDDNNTASATATAPSLCKSYTTDGGVPTGSGTSATGFDPGTGTPLAGGGVTRAPYPDECGNSYTVAITVTSNWGFYTVPFGEFQQISNPNRVPNAVFSAGSVPGTGLLTSALRNLVVRMPKEAEFELWFAQLAFYRKKAP